jgi:ribosomal-protein-alanine N-acetyltransferase
LRKLTTKRLVLEPLRRAHAFEMFSALSDPAIYRYIDEAPPASVEALAERYARLETRQSINGGERWLNWIVRETATQRAVGFVQATVKDDDTAFVAYVIAPEAQRKGFAREATAAMMAELRTTYGASKLRASVDAANAASIALLAFLGFRETTEVAGDRIFEL